MNNRTPLEQSFNSIDFLIHERPVAVYGVDLRQSSENFMRSLNADYWENIINLASSSPVEEWNHDHVSFLRLSLSQAEEQLFALIFAYLQAPFCPDLWLYHYRTSELDSLADKMLRQEPFPIRFKLGDYSWKNIFRKALPGLPDEKYVQLTSIIQRLLQHFTSDHARDEYNSMKHSMRLSFGGHKLEFAPSNDSKTPPADNQFT